MAGGRILDSAAVVLAMAVALGATPGCGDDTTSGGSQTDTTQSPTTTGEDSTTTVGITTSGITASGVGSGDADSTTGADDTTGDPDSSTGPMIECGNGVIEGDEVCDAAELSGETCESQGFDGGRLQCAEDCTGYDDSGCTYFTCGNNTAEGKEPCDGTDLAGATCQSEGFDSGALACDGRCQIDTSGCGVCGNVIVDGDEVCDDIVLFGETCESQGFDSGQLACQPDCLTYDTTGCGTCGNDLIDGAEDCDTMQLGGATCVSAGFDSGTIGCAADCAFDTEGCGICGNTVIDGDELCDTDTVPPGQTCVTEGFDSGLLSCAAGCAAYDTSGCGICGNGVVDGFETCDDGNMIDDDGCPNDCGGGQRVVFVTSQMFTGNLGGLLGADAECQALATAAGLPGVFMAWLGTDTEGPNTRMTPSTTPYVRVDGVQVAPDWAGLIDGNLDAPINVTELGGPVPIGNTSCGGGGFPTVWSSVSSNGTTLGDACANWTSEAPSSRWGRADETTGSWSSWCFGGVCNWISPIYCIQQ